MKKISKLGQWFCAHVVVAASILLVFSIMFSIACSKPLTAEKRRVEVLVINFTLEGAYQIFTEELGASSWLPHRIKLEIDPTVPKGSTEAMVSVVKDKDRINSLCPVVLLFNNKEDLRESMSFNIGTVPNT